MFGNALHTSAEARSSLCEVLRGSHSAGCWCWARDLKYITYVLTGCFEMYYKCICPMVMKCITNVCLCSTKETHYKYSQHVIWNALLIHWMGSLKCITNACLCSGNEMYYNCIERVFWNVLLMHFMWIWHALQMHDCVVLKTCITNTLRARFQM